MHQSRERRKSGMQRTRDRQLSYHQRSVRGWWRIVGLPPEPIAWKLPAL
jgi:hypothetical protein